MLIVDEQIMKSSGDKTDRIAHKPVLFMLDDKGNRDYTREREALSSDGLPYVGPLEFVAQVNLREIAGNKAFEYLQGKRYYDLTGRAEYVEVSNKTGSFLNKGKWILLTIAVSGAAILAILNFFPGK